VVRAPAAARGQPERQPGHHGHGAAAVEGEHVLRGRAVGGQRGVRREQLGPVAPQPQRARGQRLLRVRARRQRRLRGVEVDRPAVVGVDQAQVAELAALVDVGHARHRELEQLRGEGVGAAVLRELLVEGDQGTPHPLVVVRRVDGGVHGGARTPRRGRSRWSGPRPRASPSRRTRAAARARSARRRRPPARAGRRTRRREAGPPRAGSRACGPTARVPSARTAMRARTSSLRLVSWVDDAVIASATRPGAAPSRRGSRRPSARNTDGSPPTSLREVSRE
jgi:hypothetical protein